MEPPKTLSGIPISRVGLGAARLCEPNVLRLQERLFALATESGINHFDFAPTYGDGDAECYGGRLLSRYDRTHLFITSKVFASVRGHLQGLGRENIFAAVSQSLQRLKTEYLDVLYLSRFDSNTHLAQTLVTVRDLVSGGKIRYWGTSQWTPAALLLAKTLATTVGCPPPAFEQSRVNPVIYRESDRIRLHEVAALGPVIVAHSVFGNGYMGDRIERYAPAPLVRIKALALRGKIERLSKALGVSRFELLLRWSLGHPGVRSTVLGFSTLDQLETVTEMRWRRLPKAAQLRTERLLMENGC